MICDLELVPPCGIFRPCVTSATQFEFPTMIKTFDELLEYAKSRGRRTVAVAGAENEAALSAMVDARTMGLVNGILVGDRSAITIC